MINIKPVGDKTKIRATGLYQWDEFQTLVFEDPYPEGTEVHFSHRGKLVAMVYLLEEGSVQIPNLLLQKALPIMAWVYVDGKTVLEIEMPVEWRAMPFDYIGAPDEDHGGAEPRIIALEQWQLEAIDQITDRYTKDETDNKLELKADANLVYTKAEADTLLNEKADVNTVDDGLSNRYTKTEADILLSEKATVTDLTNGLNARYTKDETDGLLAVKADSLTLKNLIANGDFSQDSSGWSHFAQSSVNAINGGLGWSITGNPSIIRTDYYMDVIATQKYYIKTHIKATNGEALVDAYFRTSKSVSSDFTPHETIPTSEINYSGILTATATAKAGLFLRDKDSIANALILDNVICINLTETFGAGNEPIAPEMDKLIDLLGGWFDGEKTVPQKTLANWLLNDIRLKADKQQEDWITPTLLALYTGNIRYMKDSLGFVHMMGRASSGDGSQLILFNLPQGYKPQAMLDFKVHSNVADGGHIRILTNGEVRNGLGHVFINVDGISFRAED